MSTATSSQPLNEESLNIQALQQRALILWEADKESALELGKALIAVRDAMAHEHGAFTKWWRASELDENRVYYCIRKAEGKIKPETAPEAEEISVPGFVLNKHNLSIAKLAPRNDGKLVVAAVHVGKEGTTVTDGLTIVRVSLPTQGNSEVPDVSGTISAPFLVRAAQNLPFGSCKLAIDKEGGIQLFNRDGSGSTPPVCTSTFPDVNRIINKKTPPLLTFSIKNVRNLANLLAQAADFSGDGEGIRLAVHTDDAVRKGFATLRIDCDWNLEGQHFTGICVAQEVKATPPEKEATAEPAPEETAAVRA